jgi:hypothetical protein
MAHVKSNGTRLTKMLNCHQLIRYSSLPLGFKLNILNESRCKYIYIYSYATDFLKDLYEKRLIGGSFGTLNFREQRSQRKNETQNFFDI